MEKFRYSQDDEQEQGDQKNDGREWKQPDQHDDEPPIIADITNMYNFVPDDDQRLEDSVVSYLKNAKNHE